MIAIQDKWMLDFIIPAIDIMDGKCVRLTQGDYSKKKIYPTDPLTMAKQFEATGYKRLHIVDLDGAREGRIKNLETLRVLASKTKLSIDFGGGVNVIDDVKNILDAGASKATLGTLAVKQPGLLEEWVMEFGAGKFFIGVDVLEEKVKISGWQQDGGITIFEMVGRMLAIGINEIFCTDISKDGMMSGPGIELYKKILLEYPSLILIASGGVRSGADIIALKAAGLSGAIVGKALYE